MNDFLLVETIVGLFCVIIAEFFYMQWIVSEEKKEKRELLTQIQAQNRALISKNAHDYVMTTSIDKVMVDEKEEKSNIPDEMPEENLSDEQWYENMKKSNEVNN